MKTDNFLSLCLEQAEKSPLHYRHGAIVVRGGKVIGHGHNDYRPGFNGGSLKNGRIAKGSYDGAAIAELKKKLKRKQKCDQWQQNQQSSIRLVPFENTNAGGGHSVNQPLSMHSEMMAIYSALKACSTLSSTTFSHEKPCFNLPRADKRKARLRRAALEAYVHAVCQKSTGNGKLQVRFSNDHNNNRNEYEDYKRTAQASKESSVAFHEHARGHHHHHQNWKNEKKKNGKKNEHQYRYQYQHGQPSVSESNKSLAARSDDCSVSREHEFMSTNVDEDDFSTEVTVPHSHRNRKRKKDYKRSGKMRTSPAAEEHEHPPQPILSPTGRATTASNRQQHPRLQGADLYVARIGRSGKSLYPPSKAKRPHPELPSRIADDYIGIDDAVASSASSLSNLSIANSSPGTGSLHDELINREPSPSSRPPPTATALDCSFDRDQIHTSRPCYRCVAFMSQVGIRRVFWTNDGGEWEGAKVSALVNAMDTGMEDAAHGGPTGNGVFVTKHEVLMLRRMMGEKAST